MQVGLIEINYLVRQYNCGMLYIIGLVSKQKGEMA